MRKHYNPSLVQRSVSLFNRLWWMAPLAGGFMRAAAILLKIRCDRNAIHSVSVGGQPVNFRGTDEQVLHEVLVDQEYGFLKNLLVAISKPIVLDVGAHVGTFGIWLFGVNDKAKVLSVEADPQTYQVAMLNVAEFVRRGIEWRVKHAAAGGTDGCMLRLADTGPSMSHRIDPSGTIEVESVSFTTLLDIAEPSGAPIDLVKIDIEGAEEAFLCGTPEALRRVRALVIELHPQLCDVQRVRGLLGEYFDWIKQIEGRKSTKPLLFCRRDAASQMG